MVKSSRRRGGERVELSRESECGLHGEASAHIQGLPTAAACTFKMRPTTVPSARTSKSSSFHSPEGRDADARLRISVTAASLRGQRPAIYLSLYFLTQFLKLHAIRFEQ